MMRRQIPNLRLPLVGPLVHAVLFYDFLKPEFDPDSVDWDSELLVIIGQRLAAVAQRMLRDLDVLPPEDAARRLQDAVFRWTEVTCIASARSSDDLTMLSREGIDFVVTKGPGIASVAGRLAERPYSDIDIFVPDEQYEAAQKLLLERGYFVESKNFVPRARLDAVCREAVNLRHEKGGSIDLHHRIPPWIWGSHMTFADVHLHSGPVSVPGNAVLPCASPADNFLISALHIVSDKNSPGETLMAWRDVLQLARAADPNDIILRAREANLTGWVKWIVGALPPQCIPTRLMQMLDGADPHIAHEARLRMVIPPGFVSRNMALNQMCRLPLQNASQFLFGLLWPSVPFLREKLGDVPHPRLTWLLSSDKDGLERRGGTS